MLDDGLQKKTSFSVPIPLCLRFDLANQARCVLTWVVVQHGLTQGGHSRLVFCWLVGFANLLAPPLGAPGGPLFWSLFGSRATIPNANAVGSHDHPDSRCQQAILPPSDDSAATPSWFSTATRIPLPTPCSRVLPTSDQARLWYSVFSASAFDKRVEKQRSSISLLPTGPHFFLVSPPPLLFINDFGIWVFFQQNYFTLQYQ